MPNVKLNLSMDADAVRLLRRRAAQMRKPLGRYLAELVRQDEARARDLLALEGYRLLDGDTAAFAEEAWATAQGSWPRWEAPSEGEQGQGEERPTRREGRG